MGLRDKEQGLDRNWSRQSTLGLIINKFYDLQMWKGDFSIFYKDWFDSAVYLGLFEEVVYLICIPHPTHFFLDGLHLFNLTLICLLMNFAMYLFYHFF